MVKIATGQVSYECPKSPILCCVHILRWPPRNRNESFVSFVKPARIHYWATVLESEWGGEWDFKQLFQLLVIWIVGPNPHTSPLSSCLCKVHVPRPLEGWCLSPLLYVPRHKQSGSKRTLLATCRGNIHTSQTLLVLFYVIVGVFSS